MLGKLKVKARFFGPEAIFFSMFVGIAIFCVVLLSGEQQAAEASMTRSNSAVVILTEINGMNIATLKEAKLAKDIWIRGNDPENLKKYRGEFNEQVELFGKHHAAAKNALRNLAMDDSEYDAFIGRLDQIEKEHQVVSGKYSAQIDAHTGNTALSDANVAGIDRALSAQLDTATDDFINVVKNKGAESIVAGQQDLQYRTKIVLAWVLVSLVLSLVLL